MLPWRTLSFSPHRAFFILGDINAILTVLAWFAYCMGKGSANLPQLAAAPTSLHLAAMVFGMFMPFVLGFILTVFPKWLGLPATGLPIHQAIFLLYASGWLLFLPGLFHLPLLLLGTALIAAALLLACAFLLHGLLQAKEAERLQPTFAWLGLAGSALGALLATGLWWQAQPLLTRLFQASLLFWALPLLILSVAWRMVPFFTRNQVPDYDGRRSEPALWGWLFFCLLKTLSFTFSSDWGLLLADLGLLLVTCYQFALWRFWGPKPNMLLRSLYIALAWFPLALILYLIRDLEALRQGYVNPFLEMAALHAMAIGCFAGILMAFATRVSLGHSGRPLKTDSYDHALFWLLNLTALTRVAVALAALISPIWAKWGHWPALIWLLAYGLWAVRYIPIHYKPRLDGKPG